MWYDVTEVILMTEAEKRTRRVCFTGHRPEKLMRSEIDILMELEAEIRRAVADGFTTFISGMAPGVDIWAAEIVLRIRDEGAPIKLICASPFEGFEKRWSPYWSSKYTAIMVRADLVRYICPGYSKPCFQIRNEWMVNRSARVIAVFNGEPSGTRNTIVYANRVGVPVVTIKG